MRVGCLGGGQLGKMLALAGHPLGLRFIFWDNNAEAPAGHLGKLLVGHYNDPSILQRFARAVEVITFEFENVPVDSAYYLAQRHPLFPPARALEVSQDRLQEKILFRRLGIPTPEFLPVETRNDLTQGLRTLGLPAVLKTRRFGYDGKGQFVLRKRGDSARAWEALGGVPLLLEAFVPFRRELSVLAVRDRKGDHAFYPLVENLHREGILRRSLAPAPGLSAKLQALAERHAVRVLDELNYVGVLAIEFFPRVHNSGHWTIEGAETSQFENHMRAVAGLPLGPTAATGHSVMFNLIGELPDTEAILRVPGAHLQIYGKRPGPKRKLGHVTVNFPTIAGVERAMKVLQPLTAG